LRFVDANSSRISSDLKSCMQWYMDPIESYHDALMTI